MKLLTPNACEHKIFFFFEDSEQAFMCKDQFMYRLLREKNGRVGLIKYKDDDYQSNSYAAEFQDVKLINDTIDFAMCFHEDTEVGVDGLTALIHSIENKLGFAKSNITEDQEEFSVESCRSRRNCNTECCYMRSKFHKFEEGKSTLTKNIIRFKVSPEWAEHLYMFSLYTVLIRNFYAGNVTLDILASGEFNFTHSGDFFNSKDILTRNYRYRSEFVKLINMINNGNYPRWKDGDNYSYCGIWFNLINHTL